MITAEPSTAVQTPLEERFFDPIYKAQIPEQELNDLISNHASLAPEELLSGFDKITQRITLWLETAHMVAFTIEQEVKRGEAADRKSTRLNSSHSGESRMPSSA